MYLHCTNERVHLYIVYAVTLHQLDQNMCPTLNISGGKMAHINLFFYILTSGKFMRKRLQHIGNHFFVN